MKNILFAFLIAPSFCFGQFFSDSKQPVRVFWDEYIYETGENLLAFTESDTVRIEISDCGYLTKYSFGKEKEFILIPDDAYTIMHSVISAIMDLVKKEEPVQLPLFPNSIPISKIKNKEEE